MMTERATRIVASIATDTHGGCWSKLNCPSAISTASALPPTLTTAVADFIPIEEAGPDTIDWLLLQVLLLSLHLPLPASAAVA